MANTPNFTKSSRGRARAKEARGKDVARRCNGETGALDAMPTRARYAACTLCTYATVCLLQWMEAWLPRPSNTCLICAYSGGLWAYSGGGCVIGKCMGGVWHIEARVWHIQHASPCGIGKSIKSAVCHT